jgi:hypothetical protein
LKGCCNQNSEKLSFDSEYLHEMLTGVSLYGNPSK